MRFLINFFYKATVWLLKKQNRIMVIKTPKNFSCTKVKDKHSTMIIQIFPFQIHLSREQAIVLACAVAEEIDISALEEQSENAMEIFVEIRRRGEG